MRTIRTLLLIILLLSSSAAMAEEGLPLTLAGITLGQSVNKYMSLCDMNMASPIPDIPFMSEAHLDADVIHGIRGGSLTFANSTPEKKIVRIKLKFHDRRHMFFEKLLSEYTKKFGDPDSYRGDSFRNVIAWRWDFTKEDQRVSLLLMWSRDPQLRPGVSIKMTLDSLFDKEYRAFKMRYDRRGKGMMGEKTSIKSIDEFVPR